MKTTVGRLEQVDVPFFRSLAGQERPLGFLRTALGSEKLPHALLFLGPRGVGKASAALALAQALNCEDRQPDQDACGSCASCRRFAGGNHPDVVILAPPVEGLNPQIKIDQIRALRRQLDYHPHAGAWRVVVLRSAETLNEAAANALLKTLEEPPEGNVLVLTAVGEADLLPTIVSRCRRLTFSPLPPELIQRELVRRRRLPPESAALLAAVSYGSLGRALNLEWEEVAARRDEVIESLERLTPESLAAILNWAAARSKEKTGLDEFILLARLWYRDLLALTCRVPEADLVNQDRLADLHRAATAVSAPVLLARLDLLATLEQHLRANLNVELSLDAFGFQWQSGAAPEATLRL